MHIVTHVEYVSGYCLKLTFGDGVRKRVDLATHLTGTVFAPLRDLRRFRSVHVDPDLDTIAWDNGADMAPEFLYELGEAVVPVVRDLAVAEETEPYSAKAPAKRKSVRHSRQ